MIQSNTVQYSIATYGWYAQVGKEVAAREEAHGADGYTSEQEVTRLEQLDFGRKRGVRRAPAAARGPRAPRAPRARAPDESESSDSSEDESGDDESDEAQSGAEDEGSDEGDEGVDIAEILQQEDVYIVQKLEKVREAESGGREFLVKWKGYHRGWNTWEPEVNLKEFDAQMVRSFDARHGTAPKPAVPKPVDSEATAPARARPVRAGAQPGIAAAKRDAAMDNASSDDDESDDEVLPKKRPPAKRPPSKKPPGKTQVKCGGVR